MKKIIQLSLATLLINSVVQIEAESTKSGSLSNMSDQIMGQGARFLSIVPSKYPSFFSQVPESLLFSLSQLKAKKIFWDTLHTVPAYKKFIRQQCPNELPKTFADVPVMNKANYIKKYTVRETLLKGKFPKKGQIDTSTGTSGKPTKWIRGSQEMEHVKHWINVASRVAVGKQPYIFCNMFALGPWATGMTASYALSDNQLVLSIGPNLEMLYDALRDFGTKHNYVIAGYPPHMKKLVENAPFDFKAYNITIIVGGEAMSENVYNALIEGGIKEVYSSYGASDLRINIAQQTEFEQELQRLCKKNASFKKALLGTLEGTPNFFHYNPLLDYIEETKEGNLLFTDLDNARVSPRVRYDLGDKGKVLPISFVIKVLKKYGYTTLKPETNLPLVCLYGRGEDALTFNGCNLMYDELERALKTIPRVYDNMNRYAYNKFENKNLDQQLEFWIELKPGVALKDVAITESQLTEQVIAALCEINQDFKAQIGYINNNSSLPMPQAFLFEHGKSPMAEQSAHHKNKYVYTVARA